MEPAGDQDEGETTVLRTKSTRRRSRGQSLAEFALVFPVFMIMLGGTIQFGIIFWGQNSLNQVVRDLGRYGVTQQTDCTTAKAAIVAKAPQVASGVALGQFTLTSGDVSLPAPGSTIGTCPPNTTTDVVWLSITGHLTVPVFFPLIPGNGDLTSTATFRLEPVAP